MSAAGWFIFIYFVMHSVVRLTACCWQAQAGKQSTLTMGKTDNKSWSSMTLLCFLFSIHLNNIFFLFIQKKRKEKHTKRRKIKRFLNVFYYNECVLCFYNGKSTKMYKIKIYIEEKYHCVYKPNRLINLNVGQDLFGDNTDNFFYSSTDIFNAYCFVRNYFMRIPEILDRAPVILRYFSY